jgi:chromosome segregation ATPase
MAALSNEKATLEARVASMEANEATFHRAMEAELQEQLREREAWMEELAVELARVRAEQAAEAEGAKGKVQGELGCAVDWLEETASELAAAQGRVAELEAEAEGLRVELQKYQSGVKEVSTEIPDGSKTAVDGTRAMRVVYQSAMNGLRVELMNKAKLMGELMEEAARAEESGGSSAAAEEAAASRAELRTSMVWLEETAGQLATAMSELEAANEARNDQVTDPSPLELSFLHPPSLSLSLCDTHGGTNTHAIVHFDGIGFLLWRI